MKHVIIIPFVITAGVIITTLALSSNNDSQSQESWQTNVCDLYPTRSFIPRELDSSLILESWEFAKKYDVFRFVEPPSNIPEDLELKFLYLNYPSLLAFYGDVDWEHDSCGPLFLEHGFILRYEEDELTIVSNIIEDSELLEIVESLPMNIDDMRLSVNSKILRK